MIYTVAAIQRAARIVSVRRDDRGHSPSGLKLKLGRRLVVNSISMSPINEPAWLGLYHPLAPPNFFGSFSISCTESSRLYQSRSVGDELSLPELLVLGAG